jgi:hypothetical protein
MATKTLQTFDGNGNLLSTENIDAPEATKTLEQRLADLEAELAALKAG